MSGLHGVDPDRLDALRRAAFHAVDDLDRLQRAVRELDDVVAASVAATITRIRGMLAERWLPLLGQVAQWCELTTWARGPDLPAGAPPLASGSVDVLVADVQQWAIDRVVVVWQLLSTPDDPVLVARLAEIDRRLADHAQRLRETLSATTGAERVTVAHHLLDRLDPYAAALVLGHLDLAGAELAAAAERVLRRWHAGPSAVDGRSAWTDRALAGPDAGDLVAALVAADPLAARDLLIRSASAPLVVLESITSHELLADVLRVGLDPAVLDTAAAATVVPAFASATYVDALTGLATGGDHGAAARTALAPALTPWLLQFGPRADDWGWSPAEADRVLQAILTDPDGWRALRDAHWHWVERAATVASAAPGTPLLIDLDAIATTLEQLRLGRYDVELAPAVADQQVFDGILDAGEALLGLAPLPGGFVLGRLTGVGIAVQRQRLEAHLRQAGIGGAPADQVAHELAAAADDDRATTTLAVLTITVDRLLADGRIDPVAATELTRALPGEAATGCTTAQARRVLLERLDALGARIEPATREVLVAVVLAFTTDPGDRRQC